MIAHRLMAADCPIIGAAKEQELAIGNTVAAQECARQNFRERREALRCGEEKMRHQPGCGQIDQRDNRFLA